MSEPPANVEAEAALIGAMLAEKSIIDLAADRLAPSDFFEPVHADIFETMVREHALGKGTSPIAIKGFFEHHEGMMVLGGPAYLARLSGMADGLLAPRELAEQIRDLSRRRIIYAGLSAAAGACRDLEADIADIISQADAAISIEDIETINEVTAAECVGRALDLMAEKKTGIKCGKIPQLDSVLGAMRPKNLIYLAARPGMGKTAVAVSYSIGAAERGHGVLLVSLEMSNDELGGRMAADICFDSEYQVPYEAISEGRLNDRQVRQVLWAQDYLRGLPLHVADYGKMTVGKLTRTIRRNARRFEAKGKKLELVIVDYIQLLDPDTEGLGRYEAVSEVSRSLKAIAKDNNLAILALAQLSREVEKRGDRRPKLSDLKESGQLEQDGDAVLFLVWEEGYLRHEEPPEGDPKRLQWQQGMDAVRGKIDFIVAKRRHGRQGIASGKFYSEYQAVR